MSNSFAIPWTVAHQAPLSLEFPRQEYWSGLPFPSPGDFPDPGIEPVSPALADGFFYHWATRESNTWMCREKMLLLLAVGHWGVWKSFIFKKQKMVSFPICIYLITSEVVVQSSHVRLFCDFKDCSPTGSSVHGISQARILEWVTLSFSRGSFWPRDQTHVSCLAGAFFTTKPPRKPPSYKYTSHITAHPKDLI